MRHESIDHIYATVHDNAPFENNIQIQLKKFNVTLTHTYILYIHI